MPATEQTWRNLKVLHVVFGISAMLLLLATVVMLAVDHNRPWKKYQREFRALETWSATARVDEQESQSYQEQSKALEAALLETRQADLDQGLAREFLTQVRLSSDDAQAADLVQLDLDRFQSQADPNERMVVRGDLLERCRDIAKRAKFREDLLAGKLKLRKAEFDKARADYELGIAVGAAE